MRLYIDDLKHRAVLRNGKYTIMIICTQESRSSTRCILHSTYTWSAWLYKGFRKGNEIKL